MFAIITCYLPNEQKIHSVNIQQRISDEITGQLLIEPKKNLVKNLTHIFFSITAQSPIKAKTNSVNYSHIIYHMRSMVRIW